MNQAEIIKRMAANGFVYEGDADLLYGGWFISEESPGEFDLLEIVDGSNSGADGQTQVTAHRVGFEYLSASAWEQIKRDMDTPSYLPRIARNGHKNAARRALARAICEHGLHADHLSPPYVAVTDRWFEKDCWNKWGPRVPGWGYAALWRAIENALDVLIGGYCSPPHETTDMTDWWKK